MWRVGVWGVAGLLALAGLSGCAGGGRFAANKPVDTYIVMGQRIKTCWFNPVDPILPGYVYYADVSPDGSKVKIGIYSRAELGRRGALAYTIDFKQEGPNVTMTPYNVRMPPPLEAKMQYDLARWKRGESDCNKVMPTAGVPAEHEPAAVPQ